jgi:LysM repeat protein
VPACYTWDGIRLDDCNSFVNIQQHFYKYRQKYIDKKLNSESVLDELFLEEFESDTTKVEALHLTDSALISNKIIYEPKVDQKKEVKKKNTSTRKYKVKSGETLSEIAEKHRTSVSKIKKINHLKSDNIRIGQILKIPQ